MIDALNPVNLPVNILGYCAATLTTLSFVPQAALVIRTRQTAGISLLMYSLFTLGVALWLIYGLLERDMPLILANIVTLGLALTILGLTAISRLKERQLN